MSGRTPLQQTWNNPNLEPLFKDEELGVGAWVSPYPKVPFESVVMSKEPFGDGQAHHLQELPLRERLKLHTLADAVARMSVRVVRSLELDSMTDLEFEAILHGSEPDIRGHELVSGFGISNHPHIVVAPARRGEFQALWSSPDSEAQTAMFSQARRLLAFSEPDIRGIQAELTVIQSMHP